MHCGKVFCQLIWTKAYGLITAEQLLKAQDKWEMDIMKQTTKYLKIFCNLITGVIVLLLVIFVVPRLIVYFMPFVIGFILSLLANPVVKFLEKKIKIKRKYGSALMIVLVIGVIVLICYGVISFLLNGLAGFAEYLPTMYVKAGRELEEAAMQLQSILDKLPFTKNIDISGFGKAIETFISDTMLDSGKPTVSAISGFAKSIPDVLVSLVMGLLATYFFIADREKLMAMAERHIPKSFREKTGHIYLQTAKIVGGYFKAQFKIMGVIYVVVLIGLIILKVDYAWLIGFGIAFLDMLPVFGTGTVLCPWALVKLLSGNYMAAAGMLILYAVALTVHQLIQPKLIGDSVGMEPFATLFFMYIGYRVSGAIGMILAIPLGMILLNLYEAGAFDNFKWCVKEIVNDFNNFRKLNTYDGKDKDRECK